MKKFATIIGSALVTGVCFAQAPVIDLSTQNNETSSTESPASSALLSMEERLAILERKDKARVEAQQRVQQQLNNLQNEVAEIRGSIELHNHQLEKILQRQRDLYLELDNRFSSLQQQTDQVAQGIDQVSPQISGSNSASVPQTAVAAISEDEAYQQAVNLILKERDYDSAIPAFESFLQAYPSSSYTDNAHYWLGQLLYNQQAWERAKQQFQAVADQFADSPKRPDSLLKLGMIEKQSGNMAQAKVFFQQVVDQYADSTPARLALQQLNAK